MNEKKIIQFGYFVKVPKGIPLVDCRVIPNPYPKYAHDPVALEYEVKTHPKFNDLVMQADALFLKHDVIGVGCTYGRHRSGVVVKELLRYTSFCVVVERTGRK